MTEIEFIRPPGLSNAPSYSHVVASRGQRTIHISGQVALDAEGNLVGAGDVAAQTEQVMKNLEVGLAAADATFDDVVKITTFIVDYEPSQRDAVAAVRGRFLNSENPPASTLVGISALASPEFLIEIEATAVTD